MGLLQKVSHGLDETWEDQFWLARRQRGLLIYVRSVSGHGDLEEVLSLIPGEGTLLYRNRGDSSEHMIYQEDLNLFMVLTGNEGKMDLRVHGEQAYVDRLVEAVSKVLVSDPPSGQVHVLVKEACGYSLHSCGKISSELSRQNYTKTTLQDFDHVISCMSSKDPCGRLVVMDGPPGTGKSYAIRAMTCALKATFVIVAPSLVGSLSGPDIVPVLLDEHREGPIVLIMEDADAALIDRRAGGDLGQLSEILNLGDGLLGQLMDVRIVATTNAGRVDLDEAVMRPGRLCRHVNFNTLDSQKALEIYRSLLKDSPVEGEFFGNGTTLAEVYRAARQDGWRPKPTKGGGNYL